MNLDIFAGLRARVAKDAAVHRHLARVLPLASAADNAQGARGHTVHRVVGLAVRVADGYAESGTVV